MLTELDRSRQQVRRRSQATCVEHLLPARIIREIPAGDAAETHEPALEAAVPGVHVLYMDGAARADACPNVHCLVRNAGVSAKTPVRGRAIADQQNVRRQNRQQASRQLRGGHLTAAGMKVEGLPAAVTRDEQAVVLPMDAPAAGDTAALPPVEPCASRARIADRSANTLFFATAPAACPSRRCSCSGNQGNGSAATHWPGRTDVNVRNGSVDTVARSRLAR